MTRFFRVSKYEVTKVEYNRRISERAVDSNWRRQVIVEEHAAPFVISEDEIASIEDLRSWTINKNVCWNDRGILKLNGSSYDKAEELPEGLTTTKQKESCFKPIDVVCITLKHGTAHNLGLNGIDHDQLLLITEASGKTLIEKLSSDIIDCIDEE